MGNRFLIGTPADGILPRKLEIPYCPWDISSALKMNRQLRRDLFCAWSVPRFRSLSNALVKTGSFTCGTMIVA